MATAKALNKKTLWRDIEREERRTKREKLEELRRHVKVAREARKEALRLAKERCRTERLRARERARALRIRGLAELREAARLERQAARDACTVGKAEARKSDDVERRRAELAAEAKYRAELRRIERANNARRREHPHATYIEQRAESDDEVRGNIPADLVPLFERVKREMEATPRMTRTEVFLKYAEENPEEALQVLEDKADALVRELASGRRSTRHISPGRPRANKVYPPKPRLPHTRPPRTLVV